MYLFMTLEFPYLNYKRNLLSQLLLTSQVQTEKKVKYFKISSYQLRCHTNIKLMYLSTASFKSVL